MAAPPTLTRITVRDAVAEYLAGVDRSVLSGALTPATRNTYAGDLAEFVALAGPDTVLDDLTADDIDTIVLDYAATPDKRYTRRPKPGATGAPGRGPAAQTRFRQSVRRLFAHAARRGWVQLDPMPDTQVRPRARGAASPARAALPQATAAALLDVPGARERISRRDQKLGQRDDALLRVLLEVGPRVREVCGLDRADVAVRDDGRTWLDIRHGKGGKRRDLPLSPATAAALAGYLAAARPQPPATDPAERREDAERAVFVTFRGRRMQPRDVQNLIRRLCDALPADVRRQVTPHGLRHTAATLLLASGAADVKTVQHLLGHASLATTSVYLDEISEELARAVSDHPVTGRR